jgi:hypothetical protein
MYFLCSTFLVTHVQNVISALGVSAVEIIKNFTAIRLQYITVEKLALVNCI